MADNVIIPATGTGSTTPIVAAYEATFSGDTSKVQLVVLGEMSGTEGSRTVEENVIGSKTETAPATDTASSGLNGRLQRIAQRLTSIIALLPTALGTGGGLKVDGSGTALPVSGTVTANGGTAFKATATAIQSLMTTELNSLTNGSFATATNGYANTDRWGDFQFTAATGSNMTANNTIDLYLLTAYDGSTYAGTTGPPPGAYVGSFVCQAETSGVYILRNVPLPITTFKAYVKNGSGQNLSSSGSTLKLVPFS